MPIFRNGVKDSVYNEYFSMTLARLVGLPVPHCEINEDHDHPLYIVERYDRTQEAGRINRIHQQDFCQAQGVTSEFKYESKGGPSIGQF